MRGPNFCDTAEMASSRKFSAIAKFARHEADFHWILCQENAWAKFYSLKNIRISLPAEIFASQTFIRKFRTSHT